MIVLTAMGVLLSGLGLSLAPSASAATTLCNTTLRKGDSGSCVTKLQTRLNELGSDLVVDGAFGGKTEDEVYAFQGRSRIGFDGIVGPTTRSYLANPGTVRLTRAAASTIGAYIDSKFGSAAPTARKIASCESGYRETAINTNTNGSIDIGVFQMNTIHDGGNRTAFAHDMLYYKTNVDKAYALYVSSGGFGPWYSSQSCWG